MTRTTSFFALGVLGTSLAVLVGCGPNCQSTCDQIYNVCGIVPEGQSAAEAQRDCRQECEDAMRNTGEVGDYDPFQRRSGSGQSIVLENEAQAVLWMDCVFTQAPDGTPEQCAQLDPRSGFCAPI